jgi:hypothetical protein
MQYGASLIRDKKFSDWTTSIRTFSLSCMNEHTLAFVNAFFHELNFDLFETKTSNSCFLSSCMTNWLLSIKAVTLLIIRLCIGEVLMFVSYIARLLPANTHQKSLLLNVKMPVCRSSSSGNWSLNGNKLSDHRCS